MLISSYIYHKYIYILIFVIMLSTLPSTLQKWGLLIVLFLATLLVAGCAVQSPVDVDNLSTMWESDVENNELNEQEVEVEQETEQEQASWDDSEEEEVVSDTPGEYRDYAPELLSTTQANVLQFHADRCPSCVQLENNLAASTIPGHLNILKVDYDTETELKAKYWVTMQHTSVLVDAEGNMIDSRGWARNLDEILSRIE